MIKLYINDFNSAKIGDDFNASKIVYGSLIQMLPNETFLQVSDCQENIAFGGNLKAELVDCQDVVIKDITSNFFFTEFTDPNGIKQIVFEFGNLQDFGQIQLYLKLTHTISGNAWYSSGFTITEYQSELTERFDYINDKSILYQSIRLKLYRNDLDVKSEIKEYTQYSGNIISLRPINSFITKFKIDSCTNFFFNRLVKLLSNDIVYINQFRISNKGQLKKTERYGNTNIFGVDFDLNITETKRNFVYQIYQPFTIVSKLPSGVYTIQPTTISGTFNQNITLGVGTITLFDSNGTLIQTFNQSEITVINDTFTVTTPLATLSLGSYYFNISNGLFNFGIETIEITNDTDWTFFIVVPDYDSDDYDPDDYLT